MALSEAEIPKHNFTKEQKERLLADLTFLWNSGYPNVGGYLYGNNVRHPDNIEELKAALAEKVGDLSRKTKPNNKVLIWTRLAIRNLGLLLTGGKKRHHEVLYGLGNPPLAKSPDDMEKEATVIGAINLAMRGFIKLTLEDESPHQTP